MSYTEGYGLDLETQDDKIWCVGIAGEHMRTAYQMDTFMPSSQQDVPIMHNAKFDLSYLRRKGTYFANFHDTILQAHLLGYRPLALRKLAPVFLGYNLKQDTIIGKKGARYEDNPESVLDDCSKDAWATWALHQQFYPEIEKNGWTNSYEKDLALVPVVMAMQERGLPISDERLNTVSRTIIQRLAKLEGILGTHGLDDLRRDVVAQKFWRGKGKIRTTKGGSPSTKAEDLRECAHPEDEEWVEAYIEHQQLEKLLSTYLTNWRGKGWLHPSINQTGTMTGRFSVSSPNLQNVPKNKTLPIYQLFVAPEGYTFVSFDYSQIEYRTLANITHDPTMMAAYLGGSDLHQKTVDTFRLLERFGDADTARRIAKTINFGILYGLSAKSLAPRIQSTVSEAQEFIDLFFDTYRAVRPWQAEVLEFAEDHGYVTTFEGRPLWTPGMACPAGGLRHHAEKQATNYPIQGGAAEIVKDAMIRCPEYLVMQVHDELLYLVPENEAQDYYDHLSTALVDNRHEVPYTVEGEIGKTWGDIKHIPDTMFEEELTP